MDKASFDSSTRLRFRLSAFADGGTMPEKFSKRAARKLRRNGLFLASLLALIVIILVAVRFAPHNDNAPTVSVPVTSDA
jgi:hypothetical protein